MAEPARAENVTELRAAEPGERKPVPEGAAAVPSDRISELYYGRIWNEATQQVARDRIHWMCAQARGKHVLDVGCSQGIVSILLAREGFEVLGIDSNPEVFQFAEAEREREVPAVRSRLSFQQVDLQNLKGQTYDTVLAGEVIEHQANPRRFIEGCSQCVAEGGVLVLTTPFGLHPHPDHKATLFPRQVVEAVEAVLELESIEVVGGYIRCAATRRKKNAPRPSPETAITLLHHTERGALAAQTHLYEQLRQKNEALRAKTTAANEARVRASEHEKAKADALAQLVLVQRELEAKAAEAMAAEDACAELRRQLDEALEAAKAAEGRADTEAEARRAAETRIAEAHELLEEAKARAEAAERLSGQHRRRADDAEAEVDRQTTLALKADRRALEAKRRAGRLEADVAGLERVLGQLDDELARACREREIAAQAAERLEAALATAGARATRAELKLAEVERQVEEIAQHAADLQTKLRESEAENVRLGRESSERQQALGAAQTERARAEASVRDLTAQLEGGKRDLEATVARTMAFEKELAARQAEHEAGLARHERMRSEAGRELTRLRRVVLDFEARLEASRETLSFRLGYALLHAGKSFTGFRRLPGELLALRRDAKRRRRERGGTSGRRLRDRSRLLDRALSLAVTQGPLAARDLVATASEATEVRASALAEIAKSVRSSDPWAAIEVGREAYRLEPTGFRAKWLASLTYDGGLIDEPARLFEHARTESVALTAEEAGWAEVVAGLERIRARAIEVPPRAPIAFAPVAKRVLYVVHRSLPLDVVGYTTRTQGLLKALLEQGFDMRAVSRVGYGSGGGAVVAPGVRVEEVDGVSYERLVGPGANTTPLDHWIAEAADILERRAREHRPAIIHAASNHVNALPALLAARRLGVPFVYELRGLWEYSSAARRPGWEDSEHFALMRDLETLVAREADLVLTLSEALQGELVARGVDPATIRIVPNAVNVERFEPRPRDSALARELGLEGRFVVGFIGSLVGYEGLEDLVDAIAELDRRGLAASALIIGDGAAEAAVRARAAERGVAEQVVMVGRVPMDEVPRYYTLLDVAAFPRLPLKVCELVPPLKPFEAMAMAKPVVASDLPALREVVRDGETGLVHRAGDPGALAGRLAALATDPALATRIGAAARDWVSCERTWSKAAERVVAAYATVLRDASAFNAPAAPILLKAKLVRGDPAPASVARALKSLRVAGIMDEFTAASYGPECTLVQLTPTGWERELEDFRPELLFIESAWRGKEDLWGSKVAHMSQEVVGIVQWCRERGVPTVFWNKEDPVHFETFSNTAALFDFVFTTDIDCINRYKSALRHDRVYLLPFACQPKINNPIDSYDRKDAFCFAGAYYARYPERARDLNDFLASLPDFRPVDIYDRNYGKDDINYKFPSKYHSFIVGGLLYAQIDKAYKGYRYAINMNSIKNSQSMFARRIYELLGSNTITVSNYSRGLRLMFGDLVIAADNGDEVVRRLRDRCADDVAAAKLRLAALRKVMREHTYQDRLAYVVAKVGGEALPDPLPRFVVLGYAEDKAQVQAIVASFEHQRYEYKKLVLVVPDGFRPPCTISHVEGCMIPIGQAAGMRLSDVARSYDWVSSMLPHDYYGPNYLMDLALAARYSEASVIGKAAHYVWSVRSGLSVVHAGRQYQRVAAVQARCGAARLDVLRNANLRDWVLGMHTADLAHVEALAIDPFNYCRDAADGGFGPDQRAAVDDLSGLDTGLPLADLVACAERIAPARQAEDCGRKLRGADLVPLVDVAPRGTRVRISLNDQHMQIDSALADGKHEYWYANADHAPETLGAADGRLRFHLDVTPGLNVRIALLFLDAQKHRTGHVIESANRNHEVELPEKTVFVRLGLRIYGAGSATIRALVLGHRALEPGKILGRAEHLLLTNQYPAYDDLYRYGFVHRRLVSYLQYGTRTDVFRLRPGERVSYHEFEGIDCITGSQEALHTMLASGRYRSVVVHFLDETMWEVLKHYIDRVNVLVWVHGAEIQPLHRRQCNYPSLEARAEAQRKSDQRIAFWRGLLNPMSPNLKLVFVSHFLAEQAMEDLGFRLPEGSYTIMHNPIDTNLFSFESKPGRYRKKILSIRPFTSPLYANDLSVKAILTLSDKPYFRDLEFRVVGDGPLFEETLAPLRDLSNVIIERRFLDQREIAEMHKAYGVFLCPSRMDTQGVSRDEAMSSGLVPVTNAVAAIPEFVDAECGMLAGPEDASGLANAIARLYEDPALFTRLSANAARRVRAQSSHHTIIRKELALFGGASEGLRPPLFAASDRCRVSCHPRLAGEAEHAVLAARQTEPRPSRR